MSRSCFASFPVCVYKFSSHYLNSIIFIDNSLRPLARDSPCISKIDVLVLLFLRICDFLRRNTQQFLKTYTQFVNLLCVSDDKYGRPYLCPVTYGRATDQLIATKSDTPNTYTGVALLLAVLACNDIGYTFQSKLLMKFPIARLLHKPESFSTQLYERPTKFQLFAVKRTLVCASKLL